MKRETLFDKQRIIQKSTQKLAFNTYFDSFGIEKVRFNIANYETKEQFDIYLEFSEVLLLAERAISGSLFKELMQGPKNVHLGGKTSSPEYDGAPLSRIMSFSLTGDYVFVTMTKGKGKLSETGAIMPDGQPDKKASFRMTVKDLQEVLVTSKAYVNAYLAHLVNRLLVEVNAEKAKMAQNK